MKIKTSELIGPALDWAVAECEGLLCFGHAADGRWQFVVKLSDGNWQDFSPSTRWHRGGPIIERSRILFHGSPGDYRAWIPDNPSPNGDGPTHLLAAMRCYVASKLGEEIEIPEELA